MVTYARMARDPQLTAVTNAYVEPLANATWLLDPAGCKDEVVQRVADGLGVGILGVDKPGPARRRNVIWDRHVRQVIKGYMAFGHMPYERRYAQQPDGFMQLDNLGERPPWTIAFMHVNPDGTLKDIEQITQREPIDAGRLVWYGRNLVGSNWAGESAYRPAFGAWLLKHEVWRVHATSMRRFGMGVPTVNTPPGASQAQVQQALQMAQAMRAGDQAGMALPAGFTATLTGLTGSVPDALAFVQYLDRAMAKMCMTALIELGQTETGSRALGETFLDLYLLSLKGVAKDIGTTATSGHPGMPGIITDLVDQNWTDEAAPRLVCHDVGENYDVTAQAIQALVIAGAVTPDANLDAWLRQRWGLPARKGPWTPSSRGIPAGAGISQKDEQAQLGAQGGGGPSLAPGAGEEQAAGGVYGSARRRLPAYVAASQWEPDRHQADWDEALAQLLLRYREVWSAQRTDLVDQVVAALKAGRAPLLTVPPNDGAKQLVQESMRRLAYTAAQQMIAEAAAQGVTISLDDVALDVARLDQVGGVRTAVAASYLTQQATAKAIQVYGPTPEGFLAAADEVDQFLKGIKGEVPREQLGAALTAAQNAGRYAVLEAAPASAGAATYVAAEWLDKNTCDHCRAEDGHEFGSLAEAQAAYPTGGFKDCEGLMRCRGTVVPIWGGNDALPPLTADLVDALDPGAAAFQTAAKAGGAGPKVPSGTAAGGVAGAFNPDEPRGPHGEWAVAEGDVRKGARFVVPNPRRGAKGRVQVEISSEPKIMDLAGGKHAGFLAYRVNPKTGVAGGQRPESHLVKLSDMEHVRTAKGRRAAQTPSQFVHPDTGHKMGKTEIGDTFEALFRAKGATLLTARYGGPYTVISSESKEGGGRGARNTALDFMLDHVRGGELKTLNAGAGSQKTAIKKEEVARKDAAVKAAGVKPLLVVQVVDTATGTVSVYAWPAFASKTTQAMEKLGSYSFGPADFQAAQEATGHWAKRHARAAEQNLTASADERGRPAPDLPPHDPEPMPGDTVIELRAGVPYIGTAVGAAWDEAKHPRGEHGRFGPGTLTQDAMRGGLRHENRQPVATETVPAWRVFSIPPAGPGTLAESEVVLLPPRGVTAAFDADELRDPKTGKWIKDAEGKYLDRALKEVAPGHSVIHNGHEVYRLRTGGYRVRLAPPGGKGKRNTLEYRHAEDAAEAARRGKHLEPHELKFGVSHLAVVKTGVTPDGRKWRATITRGGVGSTYEIDANPGGNPEQYRDMATKATYLGDGAVRIEHQGEGGKWAVQPGSPASGWQMSTLATRSKLYQAIAEELRHAQEAELRGKPAPKGYGPLKTPDGKLKSTLTEGKLPNGEDSPAAHKSYVAERIAARLGDVSAIDMIDALYPPGSETAPADAAFFREAARNPDKYAYYPLSDGEIKLSPKATSLPSEKPLTEEALKQYAVSTLVKTWAGTSNDTNVRSLAIQEAAKKEFGLADTAPWEVGPAVASDVKKAVELHGPVYQKFLRAQYEATQQDLAELHVTEVSVWRGMSWSPYAVGGTPDWAVAVKGPGEIDAPPFRPLSSWTVNHGTAQEFTSSGRKIVLGASVPAHLVLSWPRSGFGCLGEYELVVLAAPGKVSVQAVS